MIKIMGYVYTGYILSTPRIFSAKANIIIFVHDLKVVAIAS
jgi:hypothetical protein